MACKLKAISVALSTFSFVIPSTLLFAQQSKVQTAFFAPAGFHLVNGMAADIAETQHLPYVSQVAKANKMGAAFFHPNSSDLLIQKAEEKFQAGKQYYQNRDFLHARTEFDAAIDSMLHASDSPTDRQLFESKLEEMVDSIHRLDLAGMGAAQVEEHPSFDKAPLEDIVQTTFPVDPRINDKVRSEMKTTASALPLVVNDTVLGYINYFNGRGRRTIEAGLERAGKYRGMISRVLAEEGVPQELIHLAQAESGFLPRAVSSAAATGMWQFVKFRGNEYGLMQTPYSDDRLDPEKATRAAARHLHDLYNEFNDWYLAIAAYNCGPGTIEKAVERTGYADYWELRARHAIPAETTNYVPIILAMTIMAKNAPEYGLDHLNPEAPLEYDTVTLTSPTHLALVGDMTDTPVTHLQQMNPALLRNLAPAGYSLRVPKGLGVQFSALLETVPAERRGSWRVHRVEQGESLAAIARRYNSAVNSIAAANSLSGNEPSAGDQLLIPASLHEESYGVRTVRTAARRSSRTSSRSSSVRPIHTASSSRRRVTTLHTATAAALRRPLHRTSETLAQVHRAHPLNR